MITDVVCPPDHPVFMGGARRFEETGDRMCAGFGSRRGFSVGSLDERRDPNVPTLFFAIRAADGF